MLARDSRNFHGWGYRRSVVAALEELSARAASEDSKGATKTPTTQLSLVQPEHAYATRMIGTNLSNFSAWHARARLLPQLLDLESATHAQRVAKLDAERELVLEALYTDPYDASPWPYHAFLVASVCLPLERAEKGEGKGGGTGMANRLRSSFVPEMSREQRVAYLKEEIKRIDELREDAEDCRWVYQTLVDMATLYREIEGTWPEGMGLDVIVGWVQRMGELDPLRMGRWRDVERRVKALGGSEG